MSEAPFARRLVRVTGMDEVGAYTVMRVGDGDGPEPSAGQFAMLAAEEYWGGGEGQRPFLPRALSIARRDDGESHFLLEAVGPGTRRLCELREGDGVWLLGPLGRGFRAPSENRRAVLVGGGVGIAPLAILSDSLPSPAGVLLGFRDQTRARAASLIAGARVATDDGSVGHRGPVTDLLSAEIDSDPRVAVYACGPPAMLEAVRALCSERSVPAQLALEAPMACGFGACFGCVVPLRGGGYLRTCLDGPVVDGAVLESVPVPTGAAS